MRVEIEREKWRHRSIGFGMGFGGLGIWNIEETSRGAGGACMIL